MARVKKIINAIPDLVPEVLEGLVLASHGDLRKLDGADAVVRNHIPDGKVALLIGGGSGHEPMYTCYVGKGLADGSVAGNVFAAPTPDIILEATQAVNRGKGVIYLYGNYAGDNMNFDIAAELAAAEDIAVETIRIADDVVHRPSAGERRGIGGAFYVVKMRRRDLRRDDEPGRGRRTHPPCRGFGALHRRGGQRRVAAADRACPPSCWATTRSRSAWVPMANRAWSAAS